MKRYTLRKYTIDHKVQDVFPWSELCCDTLTVLATNRKTVLDKSNDKTGNDVKDEDRNCP